MVHTVVCASLTATTHMRKHPSHLLPTHSVLTTAVIAAAMPPLVLLMVLLLLLFTPFLYLDLALPACLQDCRVCACEAGKGEEDGLLAQALCSHNNRGSFSAYAAHRRCLGCRLQLHLPFEPPLFAL